MAGLKFIFVHAESICTVTSRQRVTVKGEGNMNRLMVFPNIFYLENNGEQQIDKG